MIKRPPDRAAAVPIEIVQTETTIKKSPVAQVNLDFMA
jgi:hypothetical protein